MGKVKRYFNDADPELDKVVKPKKSKPKVKRKLNNEDIKTYKVNLKSKYLINKNLSNKRSEVTVKKKVNPNPKYPGKSPVDETKLKKYVRGKKVDFKNVRLNINKYKQFKKEQAIQFSSEQSARAEILLTESVGLLEADPGETTTQFRQSQIINNVDITAATKHFDLHLEEFGPYRLDYTRNGRHLLLGGRKGHVAAFDWVTKRLYTEFNVMESVHDICWLHVETMMAVAQKDWVYIYDNQGIELHCLKKMNQVTRMEFLPYHFLLSSASENGYLSWLDISIGQIISQYNTKQGRLSLLCQNPWNGVLCAGSSRGVVSMWSPNVREPLAKLLTHGASMTALNVDPRGLYLATAATDRFVKLWDVRKLNGPMQIYKVRSPVGDVNLSQKGMMAIAMGNVLEVYKDCIHTPNKRSYLRHVLNSQIQNIQFCPYEDVLGLASSKGFTSLLVPGAGEPNFDALEANPYQTKKQRKEHEVKQLLDKIQPEFITLDPTAIADTDVPTLQQKLEANQKLLFVKSPKIDLKSRKVKLSASSVKKTKSKKIMRETAKKEFVKNIKQIKQNKPDNEINKLRKPKSVSVLDRFLPTNNVK